MGQDGYDLSNQGEIRATNSYIKNYVVFFIERRVLNRYIKRNNLVRREGYLFHNESGAYLIPIFYRKNYGVPVNDLYMADNVKLFIKRFRKIFDKVDPDIVHTHGTLVPQFVFAALYARIKGKRCIATHHMGLINRDVKNQKRSVIFMKYFLHNILPFISHRVISKSYHGVNSFIFKKNVEKISGIMNVEPEEISKKSLEVFLSDNNIFSKKIDFSGSVFLYPARICKRKNQEILLEAFESLKGRGIKLILVGYIGERGYYRKILNMIVNKKLEDFVYVVPEVPNKRSLALMKFCDFLIYPSVNESTPRTCFEAFSMGIPILASFDGGHKEYLIEGENGLFFDPYDKDSVLSAVLEAVPIREKLVPKKVGDSYINKLLRLYDVER
tara:strand:+ start:11143 stop:12297 length:1155 start_codon:yes stop_codon:yes gene_type:complete